MKTSLSSPEMSSVDKRSLSSVELELSLLSFSGVSVVVVAKKLNFLENIFVNFLNIPDKSNLC